LKAITGGGNGASTPAASAPSALAMNTDSMNIGLHETVFQGDVLAEGTAIEIMDKIR
jgi:hypothetical protein